MKRLSSIVLSIAVGVTRRQRRRSPRASDEYAPDNTGRNVRDRDDRTLTGEDQSEKKSDRELTQKIRQAVVEDDALSTRAHNIKIITVDGVVTLRGPVESSEERNEIGAKAMKIAGAGKVKNQLEPTVEENPETTTARRNVRRK